MSDSSKNTGLDEKNKKRRDMSYTQNRELSWLAFNERVLDEGCDSRVPLLERLKFIAIFTSNLDEFFRVRVGSLDNLAEVKKDVIDNKTGWTATQQMEKVFERMPAMYAKRDAAFAEVEALLAPTGIVRLDIDTVDKRTLGMLDLYYDMNLQPVLSPLVIDARHPFSHLANEQLYIFSDIEDQKGNPYYGLIGIPMAIAPAYFLPDSSRYILLEDLIQYKAESLYEGFTIKSMAVVSITRNADINLDEDIDEMEDNIRSAIKKQLKKRNRLEAVRLEVKGQLTKRSLEFLRKHHGLEKNQVYSSTAPLLMKYVFMIEDHLDPSTKDKVSYRPFEPQPSPMFRKDQPVMNQIFEGDKILHYPFERMEPFLQLLKEASQDPRVLSIKITIYRMASVSKVAEYLAQAAENGKKVLVLMELRARFDEKNNIDYSERLEEAGCTIIYGFEEYKVHSKICLITAYYDNEVRTITQIGTGNYNEKTAKQYTDLSYITADEAIGRDAANFFKNMLISNLDGKYNHLLVSPTGIKPALMKLFDREIDKAKSGHDAEIILKCNSVSERDLIDKMMEASNAGVKIVLIVRGICCIRPGVPNRTENIRVISIVGRFLEHHRIYSFGAEQEDLYISSADLMTRNIMNRVEIAVPIRSPEVRKKIIRLLQIYIKDTEKAQELQTDGSYLPVEGDGIDAQQTFINLAEQEARKMLYNKELTSKIDLRNAPRMGDSPHQAPRALPTDDEAIAKLRQELASAMSEPLQPQTTLEEQQQPTVPTEGPQETEKLSLWARIRRLFSR